MKIAIVGAGISGLVAAYLLSRDHDITLFEASDYIGGHTHTVDVARAGGSVALDTGFIVFNAKTYPNFIKLMDMLGVDWQTSNMSFSVQCEKTGLTFCPSTFNSLFAQRKNLIRPSFYRMLWDAIRAGRYCQVPFGNAPGSRADDCRGRPAGICKFSSGSLITGHDYARHNAGANIAFADGHAKWLRSGTWEWYPEHYDKYWRYSR